MICVAVGAAIQFVSSSLLQLANYASASERASFTTNIVIRQTVRKFCKAEVMFYDAYAQRSISDCADSIVDGGEDGKYGRYSAIVYEGRGPLGIKLKGITIVH